MLLVAGCAQESGKTGFCDACQSSCQPTEVRRRHTSEQSSRVRRAGGAGGEPPKPLVVGRGEAEEKKDGVLVNCTLLYSLRFHSPLSNVSLLSHYLPIKPLEIEV